MLNGITVLSQTVHNFTILNEIELVFISLFFAFLITEFISINLDLYNGYLILGTLAIFFVALTIMFNGLTDKSTYPIYKVTISEEVNFAEFNDKYEIISQEGEIYEIREK